VQLTWDYNYRRLGPKIGVDLIKNPDLAEDWFNARRIINGTDKASLIASPAKKYYGTISYTTG
jgi:hypothetical protein